jgi:CheY-like chemotaxis protein
VRFLKLESFDVLAAENGTEGLALAKAQRPDLVLCDLLMPGMDGDAVLAALQADASTRSIPLIFLTASADHSHREMRLAQGAADYLVKPVDFQKLLAALRRPLGDQTTSP